LTHYPASEVITNNEDYQVQSEIPGSLAVGDNGGSYMIVFDTRGGHPWPILAIPFVPMEMSSAVVLAESFEAWMGRLLSV
jgi:hypothetical protein